MKVVFHLQSKISRLNTKSVKFYDILTYFLAKKLTVIGTIGLIWNKLKDDGKPNPDFNEGPFFTCNQKYQNQILSLLAFMIF